MTETQLLECVFLCKILCKLIIFYSCRRLQEMSAKLQIVPESLNVVKCQGRIIGTSTEVEYL